MSLYFTCYECVLLCIIGEDIHKVEKLVSNPFVFLEQ